MLDDNYLIEDEFRDVANDAPPQEGFARIDDNDGRIVIDLGDITDIDFFGEDREERNKVAILFADAMNRESVNQHFQPQRFIQACAKDG